MNKLLTIGMATYDDYDGVYFTIQALRMYHEVCRSEKVEFIVVDGNPDGKHGETTRNFLKSFHEQDAIYVENKGKTSSFDKYKIADHASGKYVLIIDCHVLIDTGGINELLHYYLNNPDCKNLIQGPLIYDNLTNISTHFDPNWSGAMYGTWATNTEAYNKKEPFEIQMQGMGLCSFERKNWPGISNNFKGFGAEEGYIAEKFRQNGGKNICLPKLRWMHRFGRPEGTKYPLILEDRIWNYFVGWLELTKDPEHEVIKGAYEHFKDKIPAGSIDNILNLAKQKVLEEGE
jgi:hypothetical protein